MAAVAAKMQLNTRNMSEYTQAPVSSVPEASKNRGGRSEVST